MRIKYLYPLIKIQALPSSSINHQPPKGMNSRIFVILVIMVHVLSVNCRHLGPSSAALTATPPQEVTMGLEQGGSLVEKRIGSSPPNCEHKCYGCSPCKATQVPTNGGQVTVSIQYSNYEPEGWKCKCGRTFYSP